MPVPIVAAGVGTVIRFIAKHGTQAAIKKFGKKAVTEISKTHGASAINRFQKGGSTVKKPVNKRKKIISKNK